MTPETGGSKSPKAGPSPKAEAKPTAEAKPKPKAPSGPRTKAAAELKAPSRAPQASAAPKAAPKVAPTAAKAAPKAAPKATARATGKVKAAPQVRSKPSSLAHRHRYKRHEIALAEGGKLVMDSDGSIVRLDGSGKAAQTWQPDDPEWERHALRFGVRPVNRTVAPDREPWRD